MIHRLEELALSAANAAKSAGIRLVLAESCTAGLVASLLSRMPGASEWLCGSAVVYRNETKTAWLGVSAAILDDPQIGPVSRETAAAMCAGALGLTPEATHAISVTGHLGPEAPPVLDGLIYVGRQRRGASEPFADEADVHAQRLSAELPGDSPWPTLRLHRQHEAAAEVLMSLKEWLQGEGLRSPALAGLGVNLFPQDVD
jgi:nicotinamide-nucleotide amidase